MNAESVWDVWEPPGARSASPRAATVGLIPSPAPEVPPDIPNRLAAEVRSPPLLTIVR